MLFGDWNDSRHKRAPSAPPLRAVAPHEFFAQGRRAEPRIAATLAALARLGHAANEADRFRLRRAA